MTARSQPLVPVRKARRRRGLRTRLATFRDLLRHFAGTGRWWLVPLVVVFFGSAILLILVQIIEYAAPFVYTLF